MLDEQLTQNEI